MPVWANGRWHLVNLILDSKRVMGPEEMQYLMTFNVAEVSAGWLLI